MNALYSNIIYNARIEIEIRDLYNNNQLLNHYLIKIRLNLWILIVIHSNSIVWFICRTQYLFTPVSPRISHNYSLYLSLLYSLISHNVSLPVSPRIYPIIFQSLRTPWSMVLRTIDTLSLNDEVFTRTLPVLRYVTRIFFSNPMYLINILFNYAINNCLPQCLR